MLLLITATTLVAVALLSVRERIRDYGVLKAIGLTPRQITSTVVSAHAALALVASLLAIPLGIGLYLAMYGIAGDTTEDAVVAPWWSLALIPIGTVLVVVAATSLPARLATRIQHRRRAPLRMKASGRSHDFVSESSGHGRRTGRYSPGQSAYASSGSSVSFTADAPYFAATSLTG